MERRWPQRDGGKKLGGSNRSGKMPSGQQDGMGSRSLQTRGREYSEENHKAIARRDARKVALAPCPESFCAHQSTRRAAEEAQEGTAAIAIELSESTNVHNRPELDDRVADDHSAFQRLGAIYAQLQRLHERPRGIEFRSILHPNRSEIYGSEGPLIVSDMGLMIWEPRWH